jgi:hypothetical protein
MTLPLALVRAFGLPDFVKFLPAYQLEKSVPAQNLKIEKSKIHEDVLKISFRYRCPEGHVHDHYELPLVIPTHPLFSTVRWASECGWVCVRMPWADSVGAPD